MPLPHTCMHSCTKSGKTRGRKDRLCGQMGVNRMPGTCSQARNGSEGRERERGSLELISIGTVAARDVTPAGSVLKPHDIAGSTPEAGH